MSFTTGVEERDKRIKRAIGEVKAFSEPMSLDSVRQHLPPDFDLDAEEFGGFALDMRLIEIEHFEPPTTHAKPMIDQTPAGDPLPETLEQIEPPRAAQPEPRQEDTADEDSGPILTARECNAAILDAQNRLGEARVQLAHRRNATAAAKAVLAAAIMQWQTGQKAYSQQDLIRDHLRSEQEKRRRLIEGGVPPQVKIVGKSAIDRARAYSRDNSPEGAARSRMLNGMSRGAFSKSDQHKINYDPRRGPVGKQPGVKA